MTNEQINTAIAEACGWVDRGSFNHDRPDDHLFKRKNLDSGESEFKWQHEFCYCNDLNAMHEAEKVLNTDRLFEKYYLALYDTTQSTRWPICATARQRAEAFLRTIGKWKEVAK